MSMKLALVKNFFNILRGVQEFVTGGRKRQVHYHQPNEFTKYFLEAIPFSIASEGSRMKTEQGVRQDRCPKAFEVIVLQ